ncbi:MAG: aminotransferase class III-fold pyridoxal phosphate-dependent enzyme, partial [Pseudomonadota bacterium]
FVAEPVVGATMGAVPAVGRYFQKVREICDRYGILLILDEVMCGMGRTGTLFAAEQDHVAADITAIAKGLGAGYQPIGAMICSSRIYETIRDGSGFFQHGHTYIGHPVACAAGHAVIERLLDDGLVRQVPTKGNALRAALHDRLGQHAQIGDIRGRGLFVGLEIVRDRDTKEPFDPGLKLHAKIKKEAFANGLICYPMGGTIDGQRGDHVLLAPPFTISDEQIQELTDKLAMSIENVLNRETVVHADA